MRGFDFRGARQEADEQENNLLKRLFDQGEVDVVMDHDRILQTNHRHMHGPSLWGKIPSAVVCITLWTVAAPKTFLRHAMVHSKFSIIKLCF